MRILFVADGRSPIALNWMRYWVERGDEVYLASTFACRPALPLSGCAFVPVAFSEHKTGSGSLMRRGLTARWKAGVRQWLGPFTLPRAARALRDLVAQVQPHLIHALRIPYEGMAAALAEAPVPLIVSVWGNDFTLHARSTPWMAALTRLVLRRAHALHADCRRDIRLARRLGFPAERPVLVVPGNGGVRRDLFYPPTDPPTQPVIVNPRGLRGYVRTDVFFRSIPSVLKRWPAARFRCVAMAGEAEALHWTRRLGIEDAVELLPPLSHESMGDIFRSAQIAVSPSVHDGTPNTLLEAMACGCLPVAGDLESVREWITHGQNGLLIDPRSPRELAEAILRALADETLRRRAARENARLIAERADYGRAMTMAQAFYQQVLDNRP